MNNINIIHSLENIGYDFEYEGNDGIAFWAPIDDNGDRKYMKFRNWRHVNEFKRLMIAAENAKQTAVENYLANLAI